MPEIVIRDIADFSHWVPTISAWFYAEWREFYVDQTEADVRQRVASWLERDRIPTALVAVADGEVVGTVALKEREFEHLAASPWLAGLYVVPHFRKCGIGAKLLHAAENKARALGMQKLYLYTPRGQRFYGTYGWTPQQELSIGWGMVTVMEKSLWSSNIFQPQPLKRRG